MTATEMVLELLAAHDKLTTRQITDRLASQGYRWPTRNGPVDVTFDRVQNRLIDMLLHGQVRRKKSMGVWVWSRA